MNKESDKRSQIRDHAVCEWPSTGKQSCIGQMVTDIDRSSAGSKAFEVTQGAELSRLRLYGMSSEQSSLRRVSNFTDAMTTSLARSFTGSPSLGSHRIPQMQGP